MGKSDTVTRTYMRENAVFADAVNYLIYNGKPVMDAPMSLHEMLETQNSELLKYVQDYKIHLIDPARISEGDLEKFKSSLGTVMGYIKYSKDKEQFARYKEKNQGKLLENKAAQVVKVITGIPMEIDEEEEEQDMCKAFEEMLEDSRNEGKAAGRLEGLQEGRNEGKLGILSQLIEQGLLTLETAAAQINMTPEEFQKAITK